MLEMITDPHGNPSPDDHGNPDAPVGSPDATPSGPGAVDGRKPRLFDSTLPLCQYGHSAGRMKKLAWLADSRANVKSFPAGVQDDIGYALYAVQLGEMSPKAKPLHGMGSGVMEIAVNDEGGTWRAVYTVSIGDSIYVVHAFQKKSKSGIATPKSEIALIRQRLKQLRSEVRNVQKNS
jgi:phage-related protein